MAVSKAVIAVAGFGTRWLPLTKSTEKCMVPILNRPVIDYVVDDCIKAGITEICFVVNEKHQMLKDYYSDYQILEDYLSDRGKAEMIELIQKPNGVSFTYIVQDLTKYGTAAPVFAAKEFVASDSFIFITGDDLIFNSDSSSEVKRLIEAVESSSASCGLMTTEVARDQISKYGAFIMDGNRFVGIVEKPPVDEAPSTFTNISRYLFDSGIWPFVDALMSRGVDEREYYITDVLSDYAKTNEVLVHTIQGKYLDAGNVDNWLEANNFVKNNS